MPAWVPGNKSAGSEHPQAQGEKDHAQKDGGYQKVALPLSRSLDLEMVQASLDGEGDRCTVIRLAL